MTCICQPTPCNNCKPGFNTTILTFHVRRQWQCSEAKQQRCAETLFSAVGAMRFVSTHSPTLRFKLIFKKGATPAFSDPNKACLHHRQCLFGSETSLVSSLKKPLSGFTTGFPTVFSCTNTPETGALHPRQLLNLQMSPSKYFTIGTAFLTFRGHGMAHKKHYWCPVEYCKWQVLKEGQCA